MNDSLQTLPKVESFAAIVIYTVISIFALVGNLVVIFIVFWFHRLRTPTNRLIANLSVADLMMAIFCIPFSYWPVLILGYWPFGSVMCKVINFLQVSAVLATSYTLVVISMDRFMAIMWPMKPNLRMTTQRVNIITVVVWLLSALIALPQLIAFRLDLLIPPKLYDCVPADWSLVQNGLFGLELSNYGVMLFMLQFVIPFFVLIVTYAGIGAIIWKTRIPGIEERSKLSSVSCSSTRTDNKDTVRKMIPMMLMVTGIYVICWLPQNILMNILYDRVPELASYQYIYHIWWASHTLAMSHSFVNPVIYCCRNKRFREGFCYCFQFLPFITYTGRELCTRRTTTARGTIQMTARTRIQSPTLLNERKALLSGGGSSGFSQT